MNPSERRGSGSIKWDLGGADEIPLWVADMDFPVAEAITRDLTARIAHPVFGYTLTPPGYLDAIAAWQRERTSWEVAAKELTIVPAMMSAIAQAVLTFTRPGDRIATFSPVYFPFFAVIERLGRTVVRVPLAIATEAGAQSEPRGARPRYAIDTSRLETMVPGASMLLLCSPHNPGGAVWSREVLSEVASICRRNGVRVVSDEIHADLTHPGVRPVPWATVGNEGDVTIVSPSKTFNIPGLPTATAYVAGDGPRREFREALGAAKLTEPNLLALIAAHAGYREGGAWLDGVRSRIEKNVLLASRRLEAVDGVRPFAMDATFILWVDVRERWGVDPALAAVGGVGGGRTFDEAHSPSMRFGALARRHGVRISEGRQFGPEGEGFVRINVATDEATLEAGLDRLIAALEDPQAPGHHRS